MSRHPATPMHEADLLKHLSRQTDLSSALIDLAQMRQPGLAERVDHAAAEASMLLFDVADIETQCIAGRELWRLASLHGSFVAGSSGVEYALLPAWIEENPAPGGAHFEPLAPVEKIAVVSGSVSPTTEAQIRHAIAHGFEAIAVDPIDLSGDDGPATIEAAVRSAKQILDAGRSVILHTALGPNADRGSDIDAQPGARHRLGRGLGDILKRLVVDMRLTRAVIAGGDTSSHALARIGVDALTVRMPLPQSPGSPLCTAHSRLSPIDGLEVALKGGQIGLDDYFCTIRDGG